MTPRPQVRLVNPGNLNGYQYAGNNPTNNVDSGNGEPKPCGGSGGGLGLSLSGDVEGGLPSSGSMATGNAGAGLFYDSANGLSAGAFSGGGAATFADSADAGAPQQASTPSSLGAYAGGGVNVFFTNAQSVQQLAGPFSVLSLNAGILLAQASLQYATSGNVWQLSLSVGPMGAGVGVSGSSLTTNTVTTHSGCD